MLSCLQREKYVFYMRTWKYFSTQKSL